MAGTQTLQREVTPSGQLKRHSQLLLEISKSADTGGSVISKVTWATFHIRRTSYSKDCSFNSRAPMPYTQITVPSVRLAKISGSLNLTLPIVCISFNT